MEPPADATETTSAILWIEDAIIHVHSKGVPSTHETVTEMLVAIGDHLDGVPRPALLDLREWPEGDPEAWNAMISGSVSVFSAVAAIIDPDAPTALGDFPEALSRLPMPFQVFVNEADALAFLRKSTEPPPRE